MISSLYLYTCNYSYKHCYVEKIHNYKVIMNIKFISIIAIVNIYKYNIKSHNFYIFTA